MARWGKTEDGHLDDSYLAFVKWLTTRTKEHNLKWVDAKAATIAAKHYGSRDAMIEAGKKRSDLREVVASKLARKVVPK